MPCDLHKGVRGRSEDGPILALNWWGSWGGGGVFIMDHTVDKLSCFENVFVFLI